MRRFSVLLVVILLLPLPALAQQTGTKITIINMDDPGEGFNDETPKSPVGGNAGTTLGQQRLIAFQHAADLWAELVDSPIEIRVEANFDPLECSATSAVLGAAGPTTVFSDFANAPLGNTWYVAALASALAQEDLNDGDAPIQARFNSSLNGDPGCAGGGSWYYGLDNNPGQNQTDLVVVVLHELAHGLGFLTTTDKDDGTFLSGRADIYATFLYDNSLGRFWPQMSSQERAVSTTNTGNLVWNGDNVTTAAPSVLGPSPILQVLSPESISGNYAIGLAQFGAEITVAGVTGGVVAANDDGNSSGPSTTDGCTPLTNAADIAGRIALIDRGECTFVVKSKNAQNAGAIGVIIANNVAGAAPGMAGDDPTITIPVVSVSKQDGAAIRGALGDGVEASIRVDPQSLAGADLQGHLKLYAPNPVQGGSSVSHWDTSAEPDLLMEPNISSGLDHGVDLTRHLFEDIGWQFRDGGIGASVGATMRDLLVADVDRDAEVDPGDGIRLICSIQNTGDAPAEEVSFEMALPDGLTVVPGSITGGAVIDQTGRVAIEIGDLPVSSEVTVVFDLQIAPDLSAGTTMFVLQGVVTGANLDAAVTDDPSTVESGDATIIQLSHTPLRAYKSVALIDDADSNGVLSEGDRLRYDVTIENNALVPVTGVTFDDPLDTNVDVVPGSVSAGSGAIVDGNGEGDRFVIVTFASVPASGVVELSFETVVRSGISADTGEISNQAIVGGGGTEGIVTDDPSTPTLFDPTIIRFPDPRKRSVRRP